MWMSDVHKLSQELSESVSDIFEQQFSFWGNLVSSSQKQEEEITTEVAKKIKKLQAPLTIFEPNVVNEAIAKAADHLHQKLIDDPQSLSELALNHFEKQQKLYVKTLESIMGGKSEIHVQKKHNDRRFDSPIWEQIPYFSFLKQSYFLYKDFTQDLLNHLHDLDHETRKKIEFYSKQLIEAISPTNFVATNPDVIRATLESNGENLRRGMQNLMDDMARGHIQMTNMEAFEVGKNLATTPGKVIYQNEILQLICYEPQTSHVYSAPLLVIPAWINKFYIFDLKEENSFVKWALQKGMRVYMVSWVNPSKKDAHKTFTDYILDGLYRAVKETLKHANTDQLNAFGYCAGGILLNCLMAYLKAHKIKSPFASSTTIAAPIDTQNGGDLLAYICESQLSILEENLEELGIIPGNALLNSFNLLKPKELMWQNVVDHYLLGKEPKAFDMLFWNCDSMNLPGKMHTQYLRHVFLDNKLMQKGGIRVAGTPIDLSTIDTPAFIVGAIKDHIVPWHAVFPLASKIASAQKEFLLVGSGHVAGIVNHPSQNKYQYWVNPKIEENSNKWFKEAAEQPGSWWNYWFDWMKEYLGKEMLAPKGLKGLEDAPGSYVLKKWYPASLDEQPKRVNEHLMQQ